MPFLYLGVYPGKDLAVVLQLFLKFRITLFYEYCRGCFRIFIGIFVDFADLAKIVHFLVKCLKRFLRSSCTILKVPVEILEDLLQHFARMFFLKSFVGSPVIKGFFYKVAI